MRLMQLLAVTLVLVSAQQATVAGPMTPKQQLIGKWSLDVQAMLKQLQSAAKTDEGEPGIDLAKAMLAQFKMEMEFTADGKLIASMVGPNKRDTKKGTYKIKSAERDSLTVSGTIDNDTQDIRISFPKPDVMKLNLPGEPTGLSTMIFKRVKKEQPKD